MVKCKCSACSAVREVEFETFISSMRTNNFFWFRCMECGKKTMVHYKMEGVIIDEKENVNDVISRKAGEV